MNDAPIVNQSPTRHAIRNRLLASMAATVALGIVMTAIVFAVASMTVRTLAETTARIDAMNATAHALQTALFTQETFAFDYALSGRNEAIEEFDAASASEAIAFADLRALAVNSSDILASATAAHDASIAWREEWAEPFLRADDAARMAGAAGAADESQILFQPAEDALASLLGALDVERGSAAAEVDASIPRLAMVILPVGLVLTILLALLGMWLTRSISGPLGRLNATVEALVAGEAVRFAAERDDELGALADVLERLRVDAGDRYQLARLEAQHAATFNQLAELTSFARDESDLVVAASRAIRRLVATSAGDILLANPSQNRLTVGIAWGETAAEPGALVNVDRIDRCPGIRRSSAFVAPNVADDMAVRCPARHASVGTTVCIPMMALGKMVGVIHLESIAVAAFDPETIRLVTRVAENVGLAMANARLMNTMEGQAMTDPLTGLRNTRFFDPYLEQELESARRDDQPMSVVMIDLDHFKKFNDTYGHPAGDEALRSFARVIGSTIRASDVAARYGGEEFIVALRHAGIDEAQAMAEKLRASIEQMVVELGPGRYARVTASLGVATTGPNVQDHKSLVSLADAALYRAKEGGRNRVEVTSAGPEAAAPARAARRRLGRIAAGRLEVLEPEAG
ncbi:MAG: diguanylate cyclase [Chloroflexi bacterium]|nr:diguanylate cyclase [Chloroflexota bacterium]